MPKFIHKPSGLMVEVGEGVALSDPIFEPIIQEEQEIEPEDAHPEPEPETEPEPEADDGNEPQQAAAWTPKGSGRRKGKAAAEQE